jgi:hypothetical protein
MVSGGPSRQQRHSQLYLIYFFPYIFIINLSFSLIKVYRGDYLPFSSWAIIKPENDILYYDEYYGSASGGAQTSSNNNLEGNINSHTSL